ncbi:hypothetical protein MBLNU230_g2119t1 [Neophaeotheca triangularis]
MRTSEATTPSSRTRTSGSLPISQLLSAAPQSPQRSHQRPPTQQSRHQETTTYGISPAGVRTAPQSSRQSAPTNTAFLSHGHTGAAIRSLQPHHPNDPRPAHAYSSYPSTNAEYGDRAHFSPAPTSYSSTASHYDVYSEPSPRSSVAPMSALQAPRQPRISQPPPYNYELSIRQQPMAARACGYGERDRRVIDPPPILELKITDKNTGRPEQDLNAMLALHCTLLSPDMKDETETQPEQPGHQTTRRLMGTLVASPYQAKDEKNTAGTFFVFPDLSCRQVGKYRLRFKLLRVDPTNIEPGTVHGSVASIVTDCFSVYTAKDFPGMRASSALLKALRRQGLNVGVKKGSEARKGKSRAARDRSSSPADESDDGDDDADRRGSDETAPSHSEGVSPSGRAMKKTKRKRRHS